MPLLIRTEISYDSASSILSGLRAKKRRLEAKIRKRLEEIIRDEGTAVFLPR